MDIQQIISNAMSDWSLCYVLLQHDCSILDGASKVKDGLNEHCIAVCRAAVNRLNHVCTQLSSGEIVVKELLRLKEKEQHLLVLCVAAKVVSTTSVLGILKQRMHELECYKSHCNRLRHLLSHAGLPQQMQGTFY